MRLQTKSPPTAPKLRRCSTSILVADHAANGALVSSLNSARKYVTTLCTCLAVRSARPAEQSSRRRDDSYRRQSFVGRSCHSPTARWGGLLVSPRRSPMSTSTSTNSIGDHFLVILPTLQTQFRIAFRHFGPEQQDDALHEAVASAFAAFVRLWERGRPEAALPCPLARYAVRHWFAGRRRATDRHRFFERCYAGANFGGGAAMMDRVRSRFKAD